MIKIGKEKMGNGFRKANNFTIFYFLFSSESRQYDVLAEEANTFEIQKRTNYIVRSA